MVRVEDVYKKIDEYGMNKNLSQKDMEKILREVLKSVAEEIANEI